MSQRRRLVATELSQDLAYGWVPISKIEKDGDSRRVYGLVTNDDIDSDEQIVDADFARKAMARWFDDGTGFGANLRQQHSVSLPPAGKGIRLEDTPKGQYIEALVVEPGAVKLVDAKVYAGFSVGIAHPRIIRDARAKGGRIVSGNVVEVSIVDRPANYSAKFAICKMEGNGDVEWIGKAVMLDEGTSELAPAPDPRRTVKRIREGAHVTIHARNEYGDLTAYEGIVTKRLRTAVALDCTRYSRNMGNIILADDDIEAAYKGSYPIEVAKVSSEVVVPDDMLVKLSLRIKNDSSSDIMAAMRRISQWALSGTSAISDTDLERVYSAYAAEFSGRNPNKRVESFPATSIGKGRIAKVASLDELVDEVLKYNENHDENGRFASGDGGGQSKDDYRNGPTQDTRGRTGPVVNGERFAAGYTPEGARYEQSLRPSNRQPYQDGSGAGKPAQTDHTWNVQQGGMSHSADTANAMPHPGGDKPGQLASLHNPDIANNQMGGTRAEHDTYGPPNMRGGYDPVVNELGAENRKEDEPEVTKTTTEANDSLADETTIATPDETKQAAEAHAAAAEAHAAAAAAAEEDGETEDAADEAAAATEHADASEDAEPEAEPDGDEVDKKAKKGAKFGSKKAPPFGKKPKATPEEKVAKKAAKVAKKAAKADPRIPTTTHPVGPEDFKRGPLAEGHASASKMDSDGSNAFDRQPASSFARPPFTNEVPNKATATPTAVSIADITRATKAVDLRVETAPVAKTYTSDELDAALSKAVGPLQSQITKMAREYEELAASPDPNRPAFRGVAGTGMNKITAPDAKKAAHKAARKAKKAEKVGYYRDLAASPDPSIRTHAQDFLAKVGKL